MVNLKHHQQPEQECQGRNGLNVDSNMDESYNMTVFVTPPLGGGKLFVDGDGKIAQGSLPPFSFLGV